MGIFNFGNKDKKKTETVFVQQKTEFHSMGGVLGDYRKRFNGFLPSSKGFLFGENGNYPKDINYLYNQSPLHQSCINFKQLLTVGNGFTTTEVIRPLEKIELNQLTNFFKKMLPDLGMDYFLHNKLGVKVTWNDEHTKIIKLERVAPVMIRIKDVDVKLDPISFLVSFDFSTSRFPCETLPIFDHMKKDEKEQLYYFQGVDPTKEIYSQPRYSSAIGWVIMDAEMASYHTHNIQNSLNPSILIQMFEVPGTDEEKFTVVQGINDTFGGTNKTGKAMVTFSNGKEEAPTVTQMEPNKLDETFLSLTDTIQRQICYAHTINPSLLGIKTPGSLGNSSELPYSMETLLQGQINPAQRDLETIFNEFIKINKINSVLTLNEVNFENITSGQQKFNY